MSAFLAGLVAGYGVAVPVGAIAVLVVGLTARTSFRVGAAAALGVATADGLYAAVATLGGTVVAGLVTPVAGPLRLVAAGVLLALAVHGAWRALRQRAPATATAPARRGLDTPSRAFLGVLVLTLLNPATIVYFAALVLGRSDAAEPLAAGLFVLGAFLASASWQLLVAAGGSLVGRALTGARGRLVTALASSTIIAALAVAMLVG
ncbi:lysine transporter LysE [Micromonospora sagamiensis]|uniref:Arginine exporter protein ArgO n=1 Tax=Micromonospora sagamiensis TaxID=47875 RepID=A0A562WDW5_9ACTN|nr:LysE family transporter [Micromonospora sagamiensis]TWJ28315.1 arginine exporter protein ArgO [Micromonospora sagamiensis]BCL12793.1 lysine transporter LysE [Micromonospora sagamiensis]